VVDEIPSDLIDRAGSWRFWCLFDVLSERGMRRDVCPVVVSLWFRGGSGAEGVPGPSPGVRDRGMWC
jgi:hypothetical protein